MADHETAPEGDATPPVPVPPAGTEGPVSSTAEGEKTLVRKKPAPAFRARSLRLTADRGPVYGPLDLDIETGALTVLHGPQGTGRTSLLLTLAGRMVPDRSSTELTALGQDLLGRRSRRARTRVQRLVGIASFRSIDDLDDSVTVGDVLRERLGWLTPWYRPVRRISADRYRALAAAVFGDRDLPPLGTVLWNLDEIDEFLLRVVLATAQRPRAVVVDDVDRVHDAERRRIVWDRLAALAATGVTVVASAAAPPPPGTATAVALAPVGPGASASPSGSTGGGKSPERARPRPSSSTPSSTSPSSTTDAPEVSA